MYSVRVWSPDKFLTAARASAKDLSVNIQSEVLDCGQRMHADVVVELRLGAVVWKESCLYRGRSIDEVEKVRSDSILCGGFWGEAYSVANEKLDQTFLHEF